MRPSRRDLRRGFRRRHDAPWAEATAARARVLARYTWSQALPQQLAAYAQLGGVTTPGVQPRPIELHPAP